MEHKTFEQSLSAENKAIKSTAVLNFLIVIALVFVIINDPKNKWDIILALSSVSILLILGLCAFLYRRYQGNTQVKQKKQASKQYQEAKENLTIVEAKIDDAVEKRTETTNNETNELKIRQSNHDNFLLYLENRLHMASTEHKRQLNLALSDLQEEFVETGLKGNRLDSAEILGIDDKLKKRLTSHGVYTANDVNQETLNSIRGLGDFEVRSLLNWRADLENYLNSTKPSDLPAHQKAAIDTKNQEQVKTIETQIKHVKASLEKDLDEIRANAYQQRIQNEQEEADAIGQRERLWASVEETQKKLQIFNKINPQNFLRRSVFGISERPNAWQKIIAAGSVVVLLGSCLVTGVYGLNSSSRMVVAMVITDTPTITLTPTASKTPTITLTPTATHTQSLTPTTTPSATLTPSKTLIPSKTATLAISWTPSITPIPSITLSEQEIMGCIPRGNERVVGVVTGIIDGDTIIVTFDGLDHIVRYIGIDAPEADAPYGEIAISENKKIVLWETVTLVADTTDMDEEGRLLRYVIVGDRFINVEMLRIGAAVVNLVEPDLACATTLETAQSEAKEANTGLWILTPSP